MTLKKLDDSKLIVRERLPRMKLLEGLGDLCYLTRRGFEAVEEELILRYGDSYYRPISTPIRSGDFYYHRKRLVDFLIKLDKEVNSIPELSLKVLKTESRQTDQGGRRRTETSIQTKLGGLVPDIGFVLRNEKSEKEGAFFVEIDTGKETISGRRDFAPKGSLLEKFLKYEEVLENGSWKEVLETKAKAFQVLTITEKEQFMKTLAKKVAPHLKFQDFFMYSVFSKMETHSVLKGSMWWKESNQGYGCLR